MINNEHVTPLKEAFGQGGTLVLVLCISKRRPSVREHRCGRLSDEFALEWFRTQQNDHVGRPETRKGGSTV